MQIRSLARRIRAKLARIIRSRLARIIRSRLARRIRSKLRFWVTSVLQSSTSTHSLLLLLHRVTTIPAINKVRGIPIQISVSSLTELERCRIYVTKEPETLDWLDDFDTNSCYFDIGANIGVYTLYPALKYGHDVDIYSFEPEALNLASLNRNININNIHNTTALPISITSKSEISYIEVPNLTAGSNRNMFFTRDNELSSDFREGAIGLSLDELCKDWGLPYPNYIKIDVDGIEISILDGAHSILRHPNLKSVLVELRNIPAEQDYVCSIFDRYKFSLVCRGPIGDDQNHIFTRRP